MTINLEKLKKELIADEGLRLKVYLCPANKQTIGVGHNLDAKGLSLGAIEFMRKYEGVHNPTLNYIQQHGIAEATAIYILDEDIAEIASGFDKSYPWWKELTDVRRRAFINVGFNIGLNGVVKFKKFLAALEAGEYEIAAHELLDSNYAKQVSARAHRLAVMIEDVA